MNWLAKNGELTLCIIDPESQLLSKISAILPLSAFCYSDILAKHQHILLPI